MVDVTLCYEWVDGMLKTIDDQSYKIRFTTRNNNSEWSAVKIKKVKALIEVGKMKPAGIHLFNSRTNKEDSYILTFSEPSIFRPVPHCTAKKGPPPHVRQDSQWHNKKLGLIFSTTKFTEPQRQEDVSGFDGIILP